MANIAGCVVRDLVRVSLCKQRASVDDIQFVDTMWLKRSLSKTTENPDLPHSPSKHLSKKKPERKMKDERKTSPDWSRREEEGEMRLRKETFRIPGSNPYLVESCCGNY
ncbi:hypothetical protein JTE90_019854 [Oedothorax gibbosus]|uniref:Uncharacterized protein n=1 Tax=Oedothorax gibbosus TaxID=931172 RepID=A0AAV6VYU3_9ARAC|nr:hypothetical protein JTE90_019854 [Oedothorax gibbosus]